MFHPKTAQQEWHNAHQLFQPNENEANENLKRVNPRNTSVISKT